jgi:hypothetical protein
MFRITTLGEVGNESMSSTTPVLEFVSVSPVSKFGWVATNEFVNKLLQILNNKLSVPIQAPIKVVKNQFVLISHNVQTFKYEDGVPCGVLFNDRDLEETAYDVSVIKSGDDDRYAFLVVNVFYKGEQVAFCNLGSEESYGDFVRKARKDIQELFDVNERFHLEEGSEYV